MGFADTTAATNFVNDPKSVVGVQKALASVTGLAESLFKVELSLAARRLDSNPRRLQAATVNAAYTLSVPAGSSGSTVSSSITQAGPTRFATALTNGLNAAGAPAVNVTVLELATPRVDTGLAGFACVSAGCAFTGYVQGTNWKYFSTTFVTFAACATACKAQAGCEGIEYQNSGQWCAFWSGGACNIGAGATTARGYMTWTDGKTCTRTDINISTYVASATVRGKPSTGILLGAAIWFMAILVFDV